MGRGAWEALEAGAAGTLCMVLSAACYCTLSDGGLLLLCDRRYGGLPFGVGLPGAASLLGGAGLRPEMRIDLSPRGLAVPEASWCLDLECRPAPPPPLPTSATDLLARKTILDRALAGTGRGTARALLPIEDTLYGSVPPPEQPDPCVRLATAGVRDLLAALRTCDVPRLERGLLGLLGLGPGLTPSMDDFLSGFTYTLAAAGSLFPSEPPGRGRLISLLPPLAERRTGRVSALYLRWAAAGRDFGLLDDALWGPDPAGAARRLLEVGHSSGADLAAGISLALGLLGRFSGNDP